MDQDVYKDWFTARVPVGTRLPTLQNWCEYHCTDSYALPLWPFNHITTSIYAVVEIKFKAQSDLIQYELTWC